MVNLLMCLICQSPSWQSYTALATMIPLLSSPCGRILLRKVTLAGIKFLLNVNEGKLLFFWKEESGWNYFKSLHCVTFAELESTATAPLQTRMNTLGNKLIALGRMYGGTERYFPLRKLLNELRALNTYTVTVIRMKTRP